MRSFATFAVCVAMLSCAVNPTIAQMPAQATNNPQQQTPARNLDPLGTTTDITASKFNIEFAALSNGFIKVFITGKIAANGADHRLLLRVNNASGNYVGFILMNGHAGGGEWDGSGFYLGRNGWGLDADFSIEVMVAVNAASSKITASGLSTFSHANNTILGYEFHGFYVGSGPISSLDFAFTGNATVTAFSKQIVYPK
jgi:hypothetical protein